MNDLQRINDESTVRTSIPSETYAAMQEKHRRQGIFGDPVWFEPIHLSEVALPIRRSWRERFWRRAGDAFIGIGCWCRGIDRGDLYL